MDGEEEERREGKGYVEGKNNNEENRTSKTRL